MKKILLIILFCLFALNVEAQKGTLLAGPMQGHTTNNSTTICLLTQDAQQIEAKLYRKVIGEKQGKTLEQTQNIKTDTLAAIKNYHSLKIAFKNLKINEEYFLDIIVDGEKTTLNHPIELLESSYEGEAKDYAFIIGSCAMDLPKWMTATFMAAHKPTYFSRIKDSQQDAKFMIWMGDYLYYRPKDSESYEGMFLKNVEIRSNEHINAFLNSMPQYAIWDDHDYGPNNSEGNFSLKEASLKTFTQFWANPYWGTSEVEGIFSHFSHQDADFFLTDGRFYRKYTRNKDAELLGEEQLQWLKEKLLASTANFKFIVMGSQAISPASESFYEYPKEREALFDFIKEKQISGVIFLSGDRHYADLNIEEREGMYPIHDFTSSPLTSASRKFVLRKSERKVATRVKDSYVGKMNFGKINISGVGEERVCRLALYDRKIRLIWEYEIKLEDLQFEK